MDYHADRFDDFSCVFRDEKGRILAVIPANLRDGVMISHQGLSFGGLIMTPKLPGAAVLEIFEALVQFARAERVSRIVYKRLPDIYSAIPAQEDLYALFRHGAVLTRRDLGSAVCLAERYSYTKGRKWAVNKAKKAGIVVREVADLAAYWPLLNAVLEKQHDTKAVHTLDEISRLQAAFPDNIKVFGATLPGSNELIAGTLVFINGMVVHTQYMANSDLGRLHCALDLVIDQLMHQFADTARYVSFGISTEEAGTVLNEGLLAQKEGFGARAIIHDFYDITII
ncbi:GNAT family N-acetyltransferase [Pseudomonas sp. HR96]|uniref:GNAT family N-acetyltransferase n=1 Tax=Pseudomonas sp. HR96 TaxID=1027966 RepID=UPI002A751EF1|nr:GNAT family N-acetyltransferase [Pseudomonas sp. HR96]WPO98868.1 GNAT family N-acetyltransferase [Pseudomonas sp. HR96]